MDPIRECPQLAPSTHRLVVNIFSTVCSMGKETAHSLKAGPCPTLLWTQHIPQCAMGTPSNNWASNKGLNPQRHTAQVWPKRSLTLLLGLALHIWMVNDLTHSHAAKDGAEEAVLPPMAMGAINEGQAQVTGEVGPFPKQGCLEWQKPTEKKQGRVNGEWHSKMTQVFLQQSCKRKIFNPFFPQQKA